MERRPYSRDNIRTQVDIIAALNELYGLILATRPPVPEYDPPKTWPAGKIKGL